MVTNWHYYMHDPIRNSHWPLTLDDPEHVFFKITKLKITHIVWTVAHRPWLTEVKSVHHCLFNKRAFDLRWLLGGISWNWMWKSHISSKRCETDTWVLKKSNMTMAHEVQNPHWRLTSDDLEEVIFILWNLKVAYLQIGGPKFTVA